MADPRGAPGTRAPSLGPNFFNFMQFWGKLAKIIGWRPHLCSWCTLLWEILDPPLIANDAIDTALIGINQWKQIELLQIGVSTHFGVTPLISMRAMRHCCLDSAVTLTVGVNGS